MNEHANYGSIRNKHQQNEHNKTLSGHTIVADKIKNKVGHAEEQTASNHGEKKKWGGGTEET